MSFNPPRVVVVPMSSGELDVQIQHDSTTTSARVVLTSEVLDALGRPEPRDAVTALMETLLEEMPADRLPSLIRFDEPSRRGNTLVARAARRLVPASAPERRRRADQTGARDDDQRTEPRRRADG